MFMNVMLFLKINSNRWRHPWDINSLQDIQKLPLMNKEDFRKEYPLGMCCVEKNIFLKCICRQGPPGLRWSCPIPEMI